MFKTSRAVVSDSINTLKNEFGITFEFFNMTEFKVTKEDREYIMDSYEVYSTAIRNNTTVEEVIKEKIELN